MKIALVIFHYGEGRGGAERAAANLARGLAARGHEIHVFSHGFDGGEVKWHPVQAGGLFKYGSFARNVERELAGQSFDIVQSFSRIHRCDVYRVGGGVHREYLKRVESNRSALGRWASRWNPKNAVVSRLEGRSFAPGAYSKIVAVSRRTKAEILANYPVSERDVWVIHNGVDTERFRPDKARRDAMRKALGLADTDFAALFAANGWKTKGLNFAIEAMGRLPENARLLVAGRGDAGAYRGSSRAVFLGPREDMPELFAAADALVHPSLHDPFPNSCLEAMASGVPVVTTSVTGAAEIMTDGKDGFVVGAGSDVGALAGRLRELLDAGRRRAMGEEARRTAEGHTLARCAEAYLAVYEEVLKGKAPSMNVPPVV
jgi:UDP-glucose:(heptosyl)LPS alpha-1,3-glucosyltransferase